MNASTPAPSSPTAPLAQGFVIAMRARVTTMDALPADEWIIVSRWAPHGACLSIARTFMPAPPTLPAPLDLMPRRTAWASLLLPQIGIREATFLLERSHPAATSIGSAFVAADGYVRLRGCAGAMRLLAEGRRVDGSPQEMFRFEAAQGPWIGEFIDAGA